MWNIVYEVAVWLTTVILLTLMSFMAASGLWMLFHGPSDTFQKIWIFSVIIGLATPLFFDAIEYFYRKMKETRK
jgi:hypothetical protein